MGEVISIYGTNYRCPDVPSEDKQVNYGLPKKQQKWVRSEVPSIFDSVEYAKDGKLILTSEQDDYASQELSRCRDGVWVWIGGRLRYLSGRYYFYLKYYTLEDGNAPDFREADRSYFLFFEYWFAVLWCLGIIRIKKRRQGASSQSCSNILYEAIFYKNSNCGLISKTREDSKATFTEMVTNAYQQLPPFFKQKLLGKEETVTELVLAHERGGNSKINYKAPVLNAYDRGRMSYVLGDEFGKLALDVPASKLLAIISKTLIKGVKRVGWIDMPSTVNELTKGGGAEYKKIFDAANQFKRNPTVNRIVRFFQPAYEAYEGFIDEYGDSVVDAPTEEQYEYLVSKWVMRNEEGTLISELSEEDIKLGAKVYIMHKRRDWLEGSDLEEEIRMNPCDEDEAFMYAGIGCEFNSINLKKQIQELEENPVFLRRARLNKGVEKIKSDFPGGKEKTKTSVDFMDDESGGWLLFEEPLKKNNFLDRGGMFEPQNRHLYQIGVDTKKDDLSLHGSKPTICVFKKSLIIEGVETGMKPVAFFIGKTRLEWHFDEEVLKACLWYGCTANYEVDARTDFYKYFWKNGGNMLLEWTPKFAQDPVKFTPAKYKPGTQSADPYQLAAQLQAAKMYIDGTDPNIYNGHVHRVVFVSLLKQLLKYDHSARTSFDEVVALMMSLLPVLGESDVPVKNEIKPKQILKQYKIKIN